MAKTFSLNITLGNKGEILPDEEEEIVSEIRDNLVDVFEDNPNLVSVTLEMEKIEIGTDVKTKEDNTDKFEFSCSLGNKMHILQKDS